jgi:hypothetical protein
MFNKGCICWWKEFWKCITCFILSCLFHSTDGFKIHFVNKIPFVCFLCISCFVLLYVIFVVSLHDEAVCVLCNLRFVRHMPMTFSGSLTKFSSNDFIYWILFFSLVFTSVFNSLIPSLEKLRVHLVFRSVIECICFIIKIRLQFRTKQTRQTRRKTEESVHKLISVLSIVYRGKAVMQPLLFEHTAPLW